MHLKNYVLSQGVTRYLLLYSQERRVRCDLDLWASDASPMHNTLSTHVSHLCHRIVCYDCWKKGCGIYV